MFGISFFFSFDFRSEQQRPIECLRQSAPYVCRLYANWWKQKSICHCRSGILGNVLLNPISKYQYWRCGMGFGIYCENRMRFLLLIYMLNIYSPSAHCIHTWSKTRRMITAADWHFEHETLRNGFVSLLI